MIHPFERADARANRARLIAAAHEVFRERGLDAEMKLIAERAGLGVGTIYRNFPTKDDLIAAIIGEAIDRIQAATEAAVAVDDPVDALRTCLRRGFDVVERYGSIMAEVMHGSLPPGCQAQFERFEKQDELAQVALIVRRGIDRGVFRADLDPTIVAVQLIAAFVPWHYDHVREVYSVDQLVEAYVGLLLHGILAPDARQAP